MPKNKICVVCKVVKPIVCTSGEKGGYNQHCLCVTCRQLFRGLIQDLMFGGGNYGPIVRKIERRVDKLESQFYQLKEEVEVLKRK